MKEIWKPVVGYEKMYAVSSKGRVKSRRWNSGYGQIRKATKSRGYLRVGLVKNKKWKLHLVHRLVLLAFVGPCPPGKVCRHFPDRDRTNNKLSNLSWATHARNMKDKKIHGTSQIGTRHGCSKLKNKDIPAIRSRLEEGNTLQNVARDYNVHHSTISRIKTKKRWTHIKGSV